MRREAKRKLAKVVLGTIGAIVAVPFLYLLAALVLGAIPANRDWREPEEGVTIFIRSNGVHTWIMVPKVNADMDWRPLVPGAHLKDPRWGAGNHVGFGYGNRTFYLETPTWGDLTMKNAFFAAVGGGRTLIHADHDHDPKPGDLQRPIRISHDQYRRLSRYIRASFETDADGRSIPLIGRGYLQSDIFYEAIGPYDAFFTCNEWTGRGLRAAGIRIGLWTPLAQSIMWRLD